MPATMKLYDTAPYDTAFCATVLTCSPADDDHAGLYDVVLDQTLFFPEEGGQTPDRGQLSVAQPAGAEAVSWHVLDVQIQDSVIHHYTDGALTPGIAVKGTIDWVHRYDNMQNHSGEHIYSGIVHSHLGCENVGFHLSERTCTMDYNGKLSPEQVRAFESEANEVITSNRPIICEYPSDEVLKTLDYRSKKELTGQIRIVTIPGCDVCACCAPHVRMTGEIGVLKVIHMQNYKGGTRLTIACGKRALLDYQAKQEQIEAVSAALCAPQDEIAAAVDGKLREISQMKLALSEARAKLLSIEVDALPAGAANVCLFEEGIDANHLRAAVNTMMERHEGRCGIFSGNEEDGYSYIIGVRDGDARVINQQLKDHFGARGGGKPAMVQGSVKAARSELEKLFV